MSWLLLRIAVAFVVIAAGLFGAVWTVRWAVRKLPPRDEPSMLRDCLIVIAVVALLLYGAWLISLLAWHPKGFV